MSHSVLHKSCAGLCRILLALGIFLGGFSAVAVAATLQWELLPDRERVIVHLNKEEGFAGQVQRVDTQGILLNLGIPPAGMRDEKAPEHARIFQKSSPRGRSLAFFTQTAAFGYIVTRPDRNTVIIDVFDDPLGARWKPPGGTPPLLPPEVGAERPPSQNATAAQPPASAPAPGAASPPAPGVPAVPSSPPPAQNGAPAASPPSSGGRPQPVSGAGPAAAPSPAPTAARPAPPVPAPPTPVLPVPAADAPAQPPATQPRAAQESAPRGAPLQPPPAQEPAEANAAHNRSSSSAPYIFRGRINPGGPSDENGIPPQPVAQGGGPAGPAANAAPRVDGANATTRQAAASSRGGGGTNATLAAADAAAPAERVVYVDAQGNPVEPPVDPVQAIASVRRDMTIGDMKSAFEKALKLLSHPELSREQREEALHLNAELLFILNKDNLAANYDKIVTATQEAINYNRQSPRNAGALLRLGYINLQVNNPSYATAYFNMLRRQFPGDESIPLTYYYWGEYHYNRNEMQLAADQFQYVVQHFSESNYAREASLGLARAYSQLGHYPQAFQVMDYIERRWPRFYLDYPPVLEMMGDIGFRMGNLEYALSRYWTYFNIVPNNPGMDVILTRIGDVYTLMKQPAAAREIYLESVRRFPDKDGGLLAMMRLAEGGINDAPSLSDMFTVFERPLSLRPAEVYASIIAEHPQSSLTPLARLKLAMWNLWNKRYEDAIRLSADLVNATPDSEFAPKAGDLALKAFGFMAAEAIYQKRSGIIQELWNKYPIVNNQQEALAPETRVALGVSLRDQGNPDKALDVIAPFFLGAKIPEYSEMALSLALDIALAHDQWQEVQDLARKVDLWQLTESAQRQLDYALALARENQGKAQEAAPLWKKLRDQGTLSGPQKAYADYFLARDAEAKRDLEGAYALGREALELFLRRAGEDPARADTGKIMSLLSSLMDITEKAGRLDEAQQYARQYQQYLKPQDAESQRLALRIAQLHKRQGNTAAWRTTLTDLAREYPDSFYGRMAASELRGEKLTEDAAQFSTPGQQ